MKRYVFSPIRLLIALLTLTLGAMVLAVAGAYMYIEPAMPDVATLRDVRLQVPLRVYSRDNRLMAQIGEQRRIPLAFESYPKRVIDAFLSAEDDRFFEHQGVDYAGLIRAIAVNLRSGEKREGGGTITMQLARNIFLTPKKSYQRKLLEIFAALKIEREFSKREILALYLNKIFLGQRAYGVGAAAEVYFGKSVDQLDLAEIALIAGVAQLPSRYNPVASPELARHRRAYVLRRMLEVGAVTESEYQAAMLAPIESQLHGPAVELEDAPYVAEMVRARLLTQLGPEIYTGGYEAITTIDSRLQRAAVTGLRLALVEYDQRHGFRGAAGHVELSAQSSDVQWTQALEDYSVRGGLSPAIVIGVEERSINAYAKQQGRVTVAWQNLEWARPATTDGAVGKAPQTASDIVKPGDIIYVGRDAANQWHLMQVPEVQGAFVALDPTDGAIVALTGGFDYYGSSFNRVVQAKRQPGSAFKPFLYSSALERGYTPATLINDAPIIFDDPSLEGAWRPRNDSRKFYGPTRMREALVRSRNLVSIRILSALGPAYATDYVQRFGFDAASLPHNLTLALGTAQVSPLEMVRGYAVFANGGYKIEPYLIDRVQDARGKIVSAAKPVFVCASCGEGEIADTAETATATVRVNTKAPALTGTAQRELNPLTETPSPVNGTSAYAQQVVSSQNVFLMTDMMADVIKRGTATRALALNRNDIAGKTGTTSDGRDTWFCGFNADIVGTAWIGFDQERSLGAHEEGGRTALPMWIYFMQQALKDVPEHRQPAPAGLVSMRISPRTGRPASAGDPDAIFETFMAGHVPEPDNAALEGSNSPEDLEHADKKDDALF